MPRCKSGKILVPWPGMEHKPHPFPTVAAHSLNHWTTREVPEQIFFWKHKNYSSFTDHTKNRPQEIQPIGHSIDPDLVYHWWHPITLSDTVCSGDRYRLKAHQYMNSSSFTWVTPTGQTWHDLTQRSRRESWMTALNSGPGSVPSTLQTSGV